MFTIKHITDTFETVAPARDIVYSRNGERLSEGPVGRPTVSFRREDGGYTTIDAGMVFVMNESGNTVSKYDLRSAEQQSRSID